MLRCSLNSLRELDIKFMKSLGSRVNIIPVIGRADALMPAELVDFKKRVMEDIAYHEIPIFSFPIEEDDDEETVQECNTLRVSTVRQRLFLASIFKRHVCKPSRSCRSRSSARMASTT